MKALLTAQQINKTDRNDARGIAQMMRVGLFKPVHVKTLIAQEQRMLLISRKLLQRKLLDLESDLRGTLRNFGLKVGVVSGGRYEARVRELVAGFPRLAAIAEPLLKVRQVMRQQLAVLHGFSNLTLWQSAGRYPDAHGILRRKSPFSRIPADQMANRRPARMQQPRPAVAGGALRATVAAAVWKRARST
jgi:hypothetical protein